MTRCRWHVPLLLLAALLFEAPGAAQELPAGHPQLPMTPSRLDPTLPPGTLRIKVTDATGKAIPSRLVRLDTLLQSPAIGEQRSSRTSTTDARGEVTFDRLTTTSEHTYSALVEHEGATYATPRVRLDADRGMQAVLRVFPSTRTLAEAQVASLVFLAIVPKDDFLQVEAALQVVNSGRVTWVPQGYRFRLPPQARAFVTPDDPSAIRVQQVGDHAELTGTVAPGEHEATFRFQLPNPAQRLLPWAQTDTTSIDVGLPPNVARAIVWSARQPGLGLEVSGFRPATPTRAPSGEPVLVTTWDATSDSSRLDRLAVQLRGLPPRGPLPFLTVLVALALLVWGAWGLIAIPPSALAAEDLEQARSRLLDELVAIERERSLERIGPTTYERARRVLLAALARVLDVAAGPGVVRPLTRPAEPR